MLRSDLTKEVALDLIERHGSIMAAAKAIAPECRGGRGPVARPVSVNRVRDWLLAATRDEKPRVLQPADADKVNRLLALLERYNIPLDSIGSIKKVRMNEWGTGMKVRQPDGTDKVVREGLYATSIVIDPVWKEGPKWPVVQPATLRPLPTHRKWPPPMKSSMERVFIIPDVQIGFFKKIDGSVVTYEPMHDEAAIECTLKILAAFRPDHVVILGDWLDCSELSKYLQLPEFQETLQPAVQYGYDLLHRIRTIVGRTCKITFIKGNHERRIAEYIVTNARAAHGLKPGYDPKGWPVLSLEHLLGFDRLNIKTVAEYPGGQLWLTKKLVCQHAPINHKTDLRASILHGHHPQLEVHGKTIHYKDGPEVYYQYCVPGLMHIGDREDLTSLCRTRVPSGTSRPNWSQGVAVVYIEKKTERFKVDLIPIENGSAIFEGVIYAAQG